MPILSDGCKFYRCYRCDRLLDCHLLGISQGWEYIKKTRYAKPEKDKMHLHDMVPTKSAGYDVLHAKEGYCMGTYWTRQDAIKRVKQLEFMGIYAEIWQSSEPQ
jgi:hypothetical protein